MWLLFALASYTIFASITVTDKYLLSRSLPDARVYAFYTGILGLFAFVFAPFGFRVPSITTAALGICAGALLIAAMFLFFSALRRGEAS
jgi:drug/metabolite transporter (DMT)-like permease